MINKSFYLAKNLLFSKLSSTKTLSLFKLNTNSFNNKYLFKTFTTTENKNQNFQDSSINLNNQKHTSSFSYLNMTTISDNKGARILRTRVGRGPGSKLGKTSGRGHKGYKARTGNPHRHFEGGQISKSRRLPKHGFRRNATKLRLSYINIDKIVYLINKKRIDPTKPITIKEILYSGGVSKIKDGVKLLGRGLHLLKSEDNSVEEGVTNAKYPNLVIEVNDATKEAIEGIKALGGKVIVKYQTPLIIKSLLKPWKFEKELVVPYPKFKAVKRMLRIEEKGAE